MRKKSCYVIVFVGILCSCFSFVWSAERGEISSGETKTGFLSSPGFMDSWNFYGEAGDRVIITAAEVSGYVEPEIYLYPPDGGELEASATGPSSGKSLDHTLEQTGLYTILVSDYYLDEEGDYGIALVKIPGAATSPIDPDGGPIASAQTMTGILTHQADTDIYQFYGEMGDRVVITVAEISGYVEPEIYLYPPDSGELEASATGPSSGKRLDHPLQQTGLYTIVISDYYLDEEGDYGIALVKIPGAATSPADPDGGLIGSGDEKTGILTHQADTDIYQFYGEMGDRVVITVAEISGYVEPEIYLYPPDGGELEASATGPSSGKSLDHTLEQTGLYTILISDYYLDEEGEYGMSLIKIPPTLPPGIYNSYPSNGSTICNLNDSFRWDPVLEATGYDLYFGEDVIEPLEKIGDNLPSPTMPFPGMELGKVYYWHVVAHTSDGDVQGPYLWFYVPDNCPTIKKLKPRSCEPRKVMRIIGFNFGDSQGDSVVHIGKKTPTVISWSDTKIKVRIPKYKCKWFKGKGYRKQRVWVTVDNIDSNKKRLKVLKPDTCP